MRVHIEQIAGFGWESPRNLETIVDFTLATIQQQFFTVPDILREWRLEGTDSPRMWGMKADGYTYIRANSNRLHTLLAYYDRTADPVGAIDTLLEIPGLNTVKAGFVAQLLGFEVGCIDSQNQKLYNVDVKDFVITPAHTARTRLRKIESYVRLCDDLGGPVTLWRNWCHFIGNKYDYFGGDEHAVSKLHVDCTVYADQL